MYNAHIIYNVLSLYLALCWCWLPAAAYVALSIDFVLEITPMFGTIADINKKQKTRLEVWEQLVVENEAQIYFCWNKKSNLNNGQKILYRLKTRQGSRCRYVPRRGVRCQGLRTPSWLRVAYPEILAQKKSIKHAHRELHESPALLSFFLVSLILG